MLTLEQLAKFLDGVWHGNANHVIFSYSSLNRAGFQDLAYFNSSLPQELLNLTSAGAVLLKEENRHLYKGNCIVVSHPCEAMVQSVSLLTAPQHQNFGIHPTAQIHPLAQLGQGVSVGAYSVIGAEAQLADGVSVGANTVLESAVSVGADSLIAHGVVIHSGSRLGARNTVNSACIIGAAPFNYSKQRGCWQQGPAVGSVILADDVHLGANTVIDRGALSDTYLAEGVCVDNLVQIAHDVVIGKHSVVAGCAAIGAYTQIGAHCIIGGASTIAASIHLTEDVTITGMSTVSKSIMKSGIYSSGTLVHEHKRWRRNAARFRRLDDYITKLAILEKKIYSI